MQSRRRIAVSAAQAEWPCFKVAVTPPSVFPVRRAPRKSCPRARRIYVTTASLLSRTSDTALTASVETNVYWAIIRAGSRRAALGWRYLNNRLLWLLRFLCLSWFPPPPLHFHHTSRKAFQLFRDNSSAFLMPAVARRVGERRGQQTISRSRRLLSWQKKIVCFLCCIIKLPNKVNLGRAGLHKSPYRITQGANFVFQASIFLFFPFFLNSDYYPLIILLSQPLAQLSSSLLPWLMSRCCAAAEWDGSASQDQKHDYIFHRGVLERTCSLILCPLANVIIIIIKHVAESHFRYGVLSIKAFWI